MSFKENLQKAYSDPTVIAGTVLLSVLLVDKFYLESKYAKRFLDEALTTITKGLENGKKERRA